MLNESKLRRVLAKMLDENEFLSPLRHPLAVALPRRASVRVPCRRQEYRVAYLPAESDSGMFGGNSNWRGPIWMPVNALHHPGPAAVLRLLRRRLHCGMPDRVRAADESVPGRRGDRRGGWQASSCETRTAGGRSTEAPRSSSAIRTGATASSFTSTSRRQRGGARRQPPDRLDRCHRADACTCSRH